MNNVLTLRNLLSMTQDEFAEHCNVSRISIARYEAGAEINRSNALKIASACGVTVDYVLGTEQSTNQDLLDTDLIRERYRHDPAYRQASDSEGRAFESHRAYHRKPRNFQGFRGFFFSSALCKMNVFLQIDALYHMQNDMQK